MDHRVWVLIFLLYAFWCLITLNLAIKFPPIGCAAPTDLFLILAVLTQTGLIIWGSIKEFSGLSWLSRQAQIKFENIMIVLSSATIIIPILGLFWYLNNFFQTPRCDDYSGIVVGLWISPLVTCSFLIWKVIFEELSIWWRAYPIRPRGIIPFHPDEEFARIDDLLSEDEEEIRERELLRAELRSEMQQIAEAERKDIEEFTRVNKRKYQVDMCAICCVDFEVSEEVVDLPNCKHLFHEQCIADWFKTNRTCPMCRGVVLKPRETRRHDLEDVIVHF